MNTKRVIFRSLFFVVLILLGFLAKPIIDWCKTEKTIHPDSGVHSDTTSTPVGESVGVSNEIFENPNEKEDVIYVLNVTDLTERDGRYGFTVHVNVQKPEAAEFKLYKDSLSSSPIQKNITGDFKNVPPLPDSVSVYWVSLSVGDSLLAQIEVKGCVPLARPAIIERMSYATIERAINNGDINNRNFSSVRFNYTNLRDGEVAQNSIANIYTMLELQVWERVKCVAATYREDNSLESITLEIVYADENS